MPRDHTYVLIGRCFQTPPSRYHLPFTRLSHLAYHVFQRTPPHPLPGAEKTAERLMLEPESV